MGGHARSEGRRRSQGRRRHLNFAGRHLSSAFHSLEPLLLLCFWLCLFFSRGIQLPPFPPCNLIEKQERKKKSARSTF